VTARPWALVPLVVAASACWIPTTRTTRHAFVTSVSPPIVERAGPIVLTADATDAGVLVTATWPRRCYRMATAVIDVTSARSGELLGTTDGETWGWWALGGMIVLWPVGIAAGIGSIIGTITSPPTAVVHPTIELRELAARDCSVPAARVVVYVTMPSGAVTGGVTGPDGTAVFLEPGGAAGGQPVVAVDDDVVDPGALPRFAVPPDVDRLACLAWRDARLAAAAGGDAAAVRDLRSIAACPAAGPREQDVEAAWALIGPAAAAALTGDCRPVVAVDRELRAHHGAPWARASAVVPAIDGCVAAAAARRDAATQACVRARDAARARAYATADPATRARRLRSLPICPLAPASASR